MSHARAPVNDLEAEFLAIVQKHGKELEDAYAKALELSDKYGIPFANHVPRAFKEKARGGELLDNAGNYIGEKDQIDLDWACEICPVDREFWESSTTRCEFWY